VRQQEATGNGEAVDAHVEVEQPAHSLIGKGLTELSGETVTRAEPAVNDSATRVAGGCERSKISSEMRRN
jgi:hypothetical protein